MTEPLIRFEIPSRADRLCLLRRVVRETIRLAGCDDALADDLVLAVNEACMNIMQHADTGTYQGPIEIEILARDGMLEFLLRDYARPVDVTSIRSRDLDDLRPGGLGVHIIGEIMDEVNFLPPPEGRGNLLRLRKHIVTGVQR